MDAPPLFVGPLFTAFSLALLGSAVRDFRRARASRSWPSVTGTITRSESVRWKATSSHTTWFVEYDYEVGGVAYAGDRGAHHTLLREEILDLERSHPEGARVPVYYDPEAPGTSVLVRPPEAGDKPYSGLVLASLGVLVGLALTAFSVLAG